MCFEREEFCFLVAHYPVFNLSLCNQFGLFDEFTNKLKRIQTEYKEIKQEWFNELKTSENSALQQYLKVLNKYNINEYYCLSDNVQGIMCKRICKARKELVVLAKNIRYVDGILWELLLENLNFLYLMLKCKYHVKFNVFELASMKHSYIDFYHQLVLAVRCWKEKGDLTIKPHYLCHDLEHFHMNCMDTVKYQM